MILDITNDFEAMEQRFKKIDIYKILAYFILCGCIGWIFETISVWVLSGELTDRGFLFVMNPLKDYLPFLTTIPFFNVIPLIWGFPIIIIYGFGGVIMILLFRKLKVHPLKIFFYGMILMTLFELLSSYVCSELLHHTYWNYHHELLNFEGRICLRSSIAWGVLSVAAINLLMPFLDRLYQFMRARRNFKRIVAILTVYILICAITKYVVDPSIIPN